QMTATHSDQVVVRAVVDIAKGLGAQTVAEFVGDDATLEMLRGFGVFDRRAVTHELRHRLRPAQGHVSPELAQVARARGTH
ncbi:MAG TPA: hypothetical protein VFN36_05170, partial [Solirubrobacteraceae bacterium]|nr:hypothetical protein [Solirubrobacteraceae bacterium]